MDLFDLNVEQQLSKDAPLPARMRPRSFDEFVGQEHIVGAERVLRRAIDQDQLPSIIIWGPPGSGKTTLANVIASVTRSHFTPVSAVNAGVADLRKAIEEAKTRRGMQGQRTILFIDEIHRFNKAQQDAILPNVENGIVTLIGATTENPSFEVISALLSRCRVYTLNMLTEEQIETIIHRALENKERGLGEFKVALSKDAMHHLIAMSNGDARIALGTLEMAVMTALPNKQDKRNIKIDAIEDAFQRRALMYDKTGEEHYNLISALHKSMRGSDPDAALYWLGRMLESGEDPLYITRRLVRFASEDVGLADPNALMQANAAQAAVHFIGLPEGNLAIAQAVVYLATAPKSNSLYAAYKQVQKDISKTGVQPVPLHLRNPETRLMKEMEYGKGYKYAHDFPGHFIEQQYLPDKLKGRKYYRPGTLGFEKEIERRINHWWKEKKQSEENNGKE